MTQILFHQGPPLPPPPCASKDLSKHGVGIEPLFLVFFGTTVFCGREGRIGRL